MIAAALATERCARHNPEVGSDLVVAIVLGLVAAAGVGRAAWSASRSGAAWQKEITARWRQIAEELGAELSVSRHGALAPRRLTLTRAHDEAVAVAQTTVAVERSAPGHTRAAAAFALGRGPRFEMRERGVGDAPSIERTVLAGHEELVRRVRMTSSDPEATGALFTDAARARAASFPRPLALRSDGAVVELLWDGVERDAATLDDALALVGELALHGVSALRQLAALDGARYEAAGGGVVTVQRGAGRVELSARAVDGGLRYEARAEPRRPLPAFEARVDAEGELRGEVPPGVVDPEVAGELARLGAATLRGDETSLVVSWDAAPERSQAEAAVRILAAVAKGGGSQGAFR